MVEMVEMILTWASPKVKMVKITQLGDTSFELDSLQPENLKDENLILSKCYRMEKKAQDQICLLINNNW
ncbi:hypothetical protein RhiirC2_763987 [Rhizophagus irregularis]|uniref:Uncharacterized protein n=1 Tax=Rhizophagus irregularis TaxID=588596 RepID=A0A2N1M6P8_9GLOM|nr:hypothetical protein RhiirC2_763987 [Rhizophagus irregularis]